MYLKFIRPISFFSQLNQWFFDKTQLLQNRFFSYKKLSWTKNRKKLKFYNCTLTYSVKWSTKHVLCLFQPSRSPFTVWWSLWRRSSSGSPWGVPAGRSWRLTVTSSSLSTLPSRTLSRWPCTASGTRRRTLPLPKVSSNFIYMSELYLCVVVGKLTCDLNLVRLKTHRRCQPLSHFTRC